MICKKCGAINDDGTKICKKCGQLLDFSEIKSDKQSTSLSLKSVKVSKKLFVSLCIITIALIVIILLEVKSGKTINLNKYLIIETTGYNGYGTVEISIDWEAIEEKYGSKISFTNAAKKEYGGLLRMMTPIEGIQQCVNVELDKSKGISNGDSVSYRWIIDEKLIKYFDCNIKYDDGSYTVSGLTEVETFDVFADVDVEFSGISPDGKVEINYKGSELSPNDLRCDKTGGLKNGDTIVVSIINKDMEYYVTNIGKKPLTASRRYTVAGLEEYVSSYEDITDTFIKKLKNEAEDSIYAYTASSYEKTSSLNNLEYVGYVFDSIKNVNHYYISSYNDIYIVYKGDVSSSNGRFNAAKVYFPVKFSNVLKDKKGNLSYEDNSGICGSSYFDSEWFCSTKGYVNPFTCYMEIVESNRSDYKMECGGGFEVYSNYYNISKVDDISEKYKDIIYSCARDKIESYIASEYDDGFFVENINFVGEILLTAKSQGNDFKSNNKYIIVYSANVSNSNERFKTTTVYFPVEYDGVVRLPNDEYMITFTVGILGDSYFPDSWHSTKGYIDGYEMYSSIVMANRENYRYEISDELKKFGK